jgi:hypothetical protein
MAKGFTQREDIDYNEIFSLVSCKDSFRIIMALVAHYDLEWHQIAVKTIFLNGDLEENVYMAQPKGFVVEEKEHIGCRMKKSIYRLKQTSRQWYLKFDSTIRKFRFKKCRGQLRLCKVQEWKIYFSNPVCRWYLTR